jgi:lipoprotein-releasing system permease protein
LNTERFLAKRIIFGSGNSNQLSRPIVRISVLGIALGLAVMILAVAIVTGFQNEIKNKLIGFGSHIIITNMDDNQSEEPQPISKNQPFLQELKNHPEINHLQIFTTKNGIVKTKTENEGILIKGVGADYDWKFIKENLKSGKIFTVSDTGASRDIVISKYLADKLFLKLNDKVVVYFLTKKQDSVAVQYEQRIKTFYVSGIYETGYEEIDKKLALVDIGQIQKINLWDNDLIGGFEITIKDYKKIDAVGADVDDIIGQGLSMQTVKQLNGSVFAWLDWMDVNVQIILILIVIVAGINMMTALLILILERTTMIGLLKAMGARNSSIQKVFLYNSAFIVGKGLLWGNVIGISIALLQQHFGIFKLDAHIYYLSQIPININLFYILLLNVGTLLCCLIMLIIPSFIVSKITPVKAIRFS